MRIKKRTDTHTNNARICIQIFFFSVNNSVMTLSRLNLFLGGYNFFGRQPTACTLFVNDLHMAPGRSPPPPPPISRSGRKNADLLDPIVQTRGRVSFDSPTGNRTPSIPRRLDGILR